MLGWRMSVRRMHIRACAVASGLLVASCTALTHVPDLTSGASDDGGAADGADAAFCAPHTFTFDPKGRVLTSVHVAGSFNAWPQKIAGGGWPMVKTGATWTLAHDLPAGRSLYKLVLNESEWLVDPANPNVAADSSDNKNSFVDATCSNDR